MRPDPRPAVPSPVFVARFTPAPGPGWGDLNARRKRLLKLALRACGLRCVGVSEEPAAARREDDRPAAGDRPRPPPVPPRATPRP